jgi:hypothetical protein
MILIEKDARQPAILLAANDNPANRQRARHGQPFPQATMEVKLQRPAGSGNAVNPAFIGRLQDYAPKRASALTDSQIPELKHAS